MEDQDGYAVYFFPPALEALGEAIKPFLRQGPTGDHVLCQRIDTAGSLIGMHLYGRDGAGRIVQVELMVPSNMVRMIVSARSDEAFGFGPRTALAPIPHAGAAPGDMAARAPEPPPADSATAAGTVPGQSRSTASNAAPAKAGSPASKPAARKPRPVPAAKSKPRAKP